MMRIERLELEVEKADKSGKDISSLKFIRIELKRSQKISEYPLTYPKMIIDSWDYADELGNESFATGALN